MTSKTKKLKRELQESCGIALTPSLIAKAQRIGDGNKSAGVRAALEAFPEKEAQILQQIALHVSRTSEGEYVANQAGFSGWKGEDTTTVFTVTLAVRGNFSGEGELHQDNDPIDLEKEKQADKALKKFELNYNGKERV